ncbi:MAG: hypothetical protein M1830_005175 [Pleopsidium flavum]|nr:MAG: hypothetical protein M1830_005175 [Pleopsidium flavum]
MYKWQVHSAIGRGRPLPTDFSRLADGIAGSLRQFHISSTRAEDEGQHRAANNPPSTRGSKRLAETTREIQNLYTGGKSSAATTASRSIPQGAVDARSLAVKPEGAPLISYQTSDVVFRGRGGLRGGLGLRGRGGFRGRGRGGRGGRGGGERGDRQKRKGGRGGGEGTGGKMEFEYTPDESKYMKEKAEKERGSRVPFQPLEVTQDRLRGDGPAVVVGEFGMANIVEEKLDWLAERPIGSYRRTDELARRLLSGEFVRFESDAEKDAVVKRAETLAVEEGIRLSERKGEVVQPKEAGFEPITEEDRNLLVERLLKGSHEAPGSPPPEDGVLKELLRVTHRNETYLPRDASSLLGKVRGLLPAQTSRASRPAGAAAR